jgi:alkaline phosphatase
MTVRGRVLLVTLFGWVASGLLSFAAEPPPTATVPAVSLRPTDRFARLQWDATHSGTAPWGHWGDQPGHYISWSNHSNRLIPVYTFGIGLDGVAGEQSPYRSEDRLRAIYGRLPEHTLNPAADYFDQTDVHTLQVAAAAAGKRRIILMVFDGMDWTTTRTAAIALSGNVAYDSGRGTGLSFQDYAGAPTAFGFCSTSPANDGTKVDVDAQALRPHI